MALIDAKAEPGFLPCAPARTCAGLEAVSACDPDAEAGFGLGACEAPREPPKPPRAPASGGAWLDFSGIDNPLGTPHAFIEAAKRALRTGELSYQPDCEAHVFRSMLARHYGLSASSFLVGSTADDLVRAAMRAFPPCTVGVAAVDRASHGEIAREAGHRVLGIPSPAGFALPDPACAAALGARFDAVVLGNPSYPASRLLPKPLLLSYLDACDWVVVDERSIDLTLGGESMVHLAGRRRNLVVVRSLCELFAMPGMPVSYCVAHPDTVRRMARCRDDASASVVADVLGDLMLEEAEHRERTRAFLDSEIPWLQCMLNLVPGVKAFPAEANYVLCSFSTDPSLRLGVGSAFELTTRLQQAGFFVRRLDDVRGLPEGRYFCVAVRTREDNERLLAAVRSIVAGR